MTDATKANIQSIIRAFANVAAGLLASRTEDWAKPLAVGIVGITSSWTVTSNNKANPSLTVEMPKPTSTIPPIVILLFCFLLSGCGSFVGTTETRSDGTSVTKFRAFTFFDAHNDLTKISVTQSTTNKLKQSFGLGSANQESSGSNAVALIQISSDALLKALAK